MSQKFLSPKLVKLILIIAVSSLLIFFGPRGLVDPLRRFLVILASPLEKIIYVVSKKTGDTFEFLGSISDLHAENERLAKENNALASKIAELSGEKKENEKLREQLGLIPKGKFELEGSFVIAQDPQRLESWVMIDKGRSSGVAKDMPVIVSDGIFVGRVEEVFPASAKVNLLTSPESSINAVDLETGARGVARGEFGLGVMMDMVSQTDVLNEGDTIVTSGLGSAVPRGLLIGKVRSVRLTEDKLFQQALISPRARYSKLDVVFVVKGPTD